MTASALFLAAAVSLLGAATDTPVAVAAPVAAVAPVAPDGTIVVPLEYKVRPERFTHYIPAGYLRIDLSATCPEGEWKAPKTRGRLPLFGTVVIGGSERLLVLDRARKDDPFYTRARCDADGDGSVDDDPACEGKVRTYSGTLSATFPPMTMQIRAEGTEGKKAPYSVRLRLYQRKAADGKPPADEAIPGLISCSLSTNCYYAGKLALGAETYSVMLGDNNASGTFGDAWKRSGRNDTLFLTTGDAVAIQDGLEIAARLHIDGLLFDVAIDTGAGRMTLTPCAVELADVRLAMKADRLLLAPAGAGSGVMFVNPATTVAVPPGSYRLVSYLASREDDGGNRWRLKAVAPADAKPVVVTTQGEALIPFGEPFTPKVTVSPVDDPDGGKGVLGARLSLRVTGASGERLTDLRTLTKKASSLGRSGSRTYAPAEATFAIGTADGKVVGTGQFKYG